MNPLQLIASLLLALLLGSCGGGGGNDVAPTAVADEDFETLPAPVQPGSGGVTGMPDAPGPGAVPLAGSPAPLADDAVSGATLFSDGVALPPLPPADGAALSPAPGAGPGPGTPPTLVDARVGYGTLPPLEDNPEAGLGADSLPAAAAPASSSSAASSAEDAVVAVRAYYDAISAGDFNRAYAAWSDGGRSSGRTPEQFASAFQDTRVIRVSIGAPGRVEGAAGSRHVEVPVTITSRGADGRELRQAGSFAMRSSVVEGAVPGWHIVSADLRELQP